MNVPIMTPTMPIYKVFRGSEIYRPDDRSLHIGWNSGFFSCNTVGLWALSKLIAEGHPVDKIQYLYSFCSFRSPEQPLYTYDLYPDYFSPNVLKANPTRAIQGGITHHGHYAEMDFEWLQPVMQRYYKPSPKVLALVEEWKVKYGFESSRTIGVCYRGTDKAREIELAAPRAFVEATRHMLKNDQDLSILIQTDQRQVRDLFISEFGKSCWFIEEMPVTEGQRVIHNLTTDERACDPYTLGLRIMAATVMLSQCAYLVNHTGNMGLWIALFRGGFDNAIQFDEYGKLATHSRRYWTQLRRKILGRLIAN